MDLNNIAEIKEFVTKIVKKKNKRHKVYCCFAGDKLMEGYAGITFYLNKKTSFVNLSWPKWLLMSDYQKKKAIIHEVCHILAALDGERSGHGPVWAIQMRRFGYRPDITMRV